MSYKVPSLEEFTGFLVAFWKVVFPLSNVGSRFSYHWKRLRVYAGGVTDLHANVGSAQNDVMPDSSQGGFLTRWGGIVGVPRKDATPARGENVLRVMGTPAAAVTIGDQLNHAPTGQVFEVTENAVIPGGGTYVDVDVAGVSTGASTRLLSGESLSFVAPPAGISTIARLVGDLDQDGFDAEKDPAYSVRVNGELGKPRMGGNQDDFVKWALQVTGVSSAYCYPNRAGVGTVDIAALHTGDGSARSLTPTERTALLTYIQGLAPSQVSGTGGSLRVLETVVDDQDVEITVVPNGDPSAAFDWDDSIAPIVSAFNAGTREVTFTLDLPGSLIAGLRVTFRGVASIQSGQEYTVERISATDKLILRETIAVNLVATDVMYSGGPLVTPIRDAIVANMNGEIVYADKGKPLPASHAGSRVGLRILADGIGTANPDGVYGPWSGAIVRAVLTKIAAFPTGARNVTIVTPAADYEADDPAFPGDAQIGFVAPRAVLVRKG